MKQFFKDAKDQLSSYRLIFICWGLGSLITWAAMLFINPDVKVLTPELVALLVAFTLGKTTSKKLEGNTVAKTDIPEDNTPIKITDPIGFIVEKEDANNE